MRQVPYGAEGGPRYESPADRDYLRVGREGGVGRCGGGRADGGGQNAHDDGRRRRRGGRHPTLHSAGKHAHAPIRQVYSASMRTHSLSPVKRRGRVRPSGASVCFDVDIRIALALPNELRTPVPVGRG